MTKKNLYLLGWSLIIGINLYFVYNFPIKYFNYTSWNKPYGPLLQIHIAFGMISILVGPLQFFSIIRRQYPYFHRLIGRIYLFSVAVAAISAIKLGISHNIIDQNKVTFGTGILGLAAAWLLTSGMALWAIKYRNFVQHREWMIKSYVVTCGFTTFRIFAVSLSSYIQIDYRKDISGIMAWACWSIPLLLTEVLLQARKIRKSSIVEQVATKSSLNKLERA